MEPRQTYDESGALPFGTLLTPAERDAMLRRYYERMSQARPILARTRPDWLARRLIARQRLQSLLSLDPWPERPPLEPVVSGVLLRDGYRVERIYYQAWPGHFAGGWLYLPDRLQAPAPAVLCPHGHWEDGAMHPVVQARCIGLARKGFVAFAIDSVHTYRYDVGLTPMTAMTWNNIRALDLLAGRAEVDVARIGCTGASGGGQQTMFLMALDDRVRVAVPAVYVSYLHRILMPVGHHCPCNHVPGLLRETDEPEICALFAPRPLLFLTVSGDWTAPFPEQELLDLRRVYRLYGQADRLDHAQFPGHHDYSQPMRERAFAWFLRWLCDVSDPEAALEPPITPEPVETLAALSRPPAEANRWDRLGDTVLRRVLFQAPKIEGRDARKNYQERLRGELADLLGEPATPCAPEPELRSVETHSGVRWELLTYRSEREVRVPALLGYRVLDGLATEAGAPKAWGRAPGERTERRGAVAGSQVGKLQVGDHLEPANLQTFNAKPSSVPSVSSVANPKSEAPAPGERPVAVLLHPEGKGAWFDASGPGELLAALLAAGYAVFLPDVRLRGELRREWRCNEIVWGRPEAGMAVTDLRAAFDMLLGRADVDARQLALVGAGEMGIAALLAAGLDERVAATVADAGATTYQDGGEGLPLIPNLLRCADTPQIASLAAPRPLWLYRVPAERAGFASRRYFDWTLRSYQSLGARDALRLDTGSDSPPAAEIVRWLDQALRRKPARART